MQSIEKHFLHRHTFNECGDMTNCAAVGKHESSSVVCIFYKTQVQQSTVATVVVIRSGHQLVTSIRSKI